MIRRRELRRRLRRRLVRKLRGAERDASTGSLVDLLSDLLTHADPLLRAARSFLATRRDLFTAAEVRRLTTGSRSGEETAKGMVQETPFDDGSGRELRQRRPTVPIDLPSRAGRLRPLWTELGKECLAGGDARRTAKILRADFAARLHRRLDLRATARDLARLPRASVRTDAPVLLSLSTERGLVYEKKASASSPRRRARRAPGTELAQAAWLAQAFETGRVFERPTESSWRRGEGNTIRVLDGPLLRLDAEATRHLERYVSATLLERRDAATDALVRLLDPPPDDAVRRELRGRIRQLVPDRDRLDGDWRDRPENNLLGHWRLATGLGLRPVPGLLAFWTGLATWEERDGDLVRAHQRWLASRTADALCSDARTRWLTDLGEKAARWLDRPVLGE